MADWTLPALTSNYTDVLNDLKNRDENSVKMLDGTTDTNLPVGAKRWSSTNARFEKWDGSAWAELVTLYNINVAQLEGHSASYFLPATGTAVNADKLDDIDSTGFVRSYKSNVTLQDNSTYTTVATVKGSNLGSAVRLAISGTTTNVVINVVADILVGLNHDILVKSISGNYTQCYINIISDGNDSFDIQLKASSTVNNIPTSLEIAPLNGESVTFTSTSSYSTTTHEHLTRQGINVSSTDNTQLMYLNGAKVWHSGNDGAGSGLDADLLDGYTSSTQNIINTVAVRNASGDIAMRLPRIEYTGDGWNGLYILGINALGGVDTDNYARPTPVPTWNQDTLGSARKWNGSTQSTSTAAPSGGVDGDIWFQY